MKNIQKYREFFEAYEEGYFMYKEGRVYRKKVWDNKKKKYVTTDNPEVASRPTKSGYRRIKFGGQYFYEHVCVYAIFYGIEGLEACEDIDHVDCDKSNNYIDNLEGVTRKENNRRAEENNLVGRTYGEINGRAKLTDEKVEEIRTLYKSQDYTQRDLAKKYGISQGHVSELVNYKKWAITVR